VAVRAIDMGQNGAATVTSDVIRAWNPRHVLLVGIAGGVEDRGARFGDVVIPHVVRYYEPSKLLGGTVEDRTHHFYPDAGLESTAQDMALEVSLGYRADWEAWIAMPRPDASHDHVGVLTQELATGEQVWADLSATDVQRVLAQFPKVNAIENEAAGVFRASRDSASRPGALVVKAFSDLIQNKNDEWREYAARASAAFALGLIKRVGNRWAAAPSASVSGPARSSLPVPQTNFIGREGEIQDVSKLLQRREGVVTLTGTGGTGKTRLALQVASRLQAYYEGGIFYCRIEDSRGSDSALTAIAAALGAIGTDELRTRLQQLCANGRVLLLLDDFDPVVSAASDIAKLQRETESLSILVTSREKLRISNEVLFPVAPMAIPLDPAKASFGEIASHDSVMLFDARARRASPGWQLVVENAADVGQICKRLDGLPLAIELAAARINIFKPGQILERLDHRLALLSRGDRDSVVRHQGLRAAFDWSYELLEPSEQSLLAALSVFDGGFSIDTVEAVCAPAIAGVEGMPDLLASLMDKSWLLPVVGTGVSMRLRMLDTIREYGSEKIEGSRLSTAIKQRHCAYFLELASSTQLKALEVHRGSWLRRLEDDYENIRSALLRSRDNDENLVAGVRAASALSGFWTSTGRAGEGHSLLRQVSFGGPLPVQETIDALHAGARLSMAQGQAGRAVQYLTRALKLAQETDKPRDVALCLSDLGLAHLESSNFDEARSLLRRALKMWTTLSDGHSAQSVIANLEQLELRTGDVSHAEQRFRELIAYFREVGAWAQVAVLLNNLAGVAFRKGDIDEASAMLQEALSISQGRGDVEGAATAKHNMGTFFLERKEYDLGKTLLLEVYALRSETGNYQGLELTCKNLAAVYYELGDRNAAWEMYKEFIEHSWDMGNETYLREGLYKLGTLAVIMHKWKTGLILLVASRHQTYKGVLSVAFDKAAFDIAYSAAIVVLGASQLNDYWLQGQRITLSEAVSLALGAP
jgi:predicted ATPase/nucleoside phosphorylase/Flp pilus assembly protein TadD